MKKTTRRLRLDPQTIATLTRDQLGRAGGGFAEVAQEPCSPCCPTYRCITTQATVYQCPSLVLTCITCPQ